MYPIRRRIKWVERHGFRGFGTLDSLERRARYAIGESEAADKPQATLRRGAEADRKILAWIALLQGMVRSKRPWVGQNA